MLTLVTNEDAVPIRDLVTKDRNAVESWPLILPQIIAYIPDENRITTLINAGRIEEAVLQSLLIWTAKGKDPDELLNVFRNQGLHALTGNPKNS